MQLLGSLVRIAIIVFWLGLLYEQYMWSDQPGGVSAGVVAATAATTSADDEEWMGVYVNDRKVGYTRRRLSTDGNGYRFEERSFLRLSVMDAEQTVRTEMRGTVGPDYALRSFAMTLRSGAGNLEADGRVDASHLDLGINANGQESRQQVQLNAPLYAPSLARDRLVRGGLAAGRELTVSVFDPASMQNQPLHLKVVSREASEGEGPAQALWQVREEFRGIDSAIWLDARGRVMREEGPMGFKAVRESRDQALTAGWKAGAAFDLMGAVAIPVRNIPNPRSLVHLEAHLDGLHNVKVPVDARQQMNGNTLKITREDTDSTDSYALPYHDAEWQSELAATAFLQADDPRIKAKANEILAGATDARQAAERLRTWIFRSLKKVPTASIPNALQVLAMGEGDCNEHAVLFAALARAAGLPARVVAGTVYVDETFLYHAWNEVWLGSSWVSVDTTMDQMPVDATHIKLLEGGPETHVALVPLIGSLTIDVVRAE